MKRTLLQLSARMRFVMAMLAMFGAIWATVDLHSHKDGLHKPIHCLVCSLEKPVSYGFTFHTTTKIIVHANIFIPVLWQTQKPRSFCTRFFSIRAPPFA